MSPLDQALAYAARGWPVFPCREREPGRKRPYTPRGFHDATTDAAIIEPWWRRWPNALIGLPTGAASGVVVLDIDVKNPPTNGCDSLEDLGHVLPATPMVHTPSRGLHVHFANPERELRCSAGLIGPGLDVRGEGGYLILPSPGSGYRWDPIHHSGSVAPRTRAGLALAGQAVNSGAGNAIAAGQGTRSLRRIGNQRRVRCDFPCRGRRARTHVKRRVFFDRHAGRCRRCAGGTRLIGAVAGRSRYDEP
jgi:hypothetical protein